MGEVGTYLLADRCTYLLANERGTYLLADGGVPTFPLMGEGGPSCQLGEGYIPSS